MIAADTHAKLSGRFVVHVLSVDGALATVRPLGRLNRLCVPVTSLRETHHPLRSEDRRGRKPGLSPSVRARHLALLAALVAARPEGITQAALRDAGFTMCQFDLPRLRRGGLAEVAGGGRGRLGGYVWRVTAQGLEALAEPAQEPAA